MEQQELNNKLFDAIKCDDSKQVVSLLDQGADLGAENEEHELPLIVATKLNRLEVLKILFSFGADSYNDYTDNTTPLHCAKRPEIAELLLEYGADVNAKNSAGDTPLHYAVKKNSTEIVNVLIEYNADVNAKNNTGNIPLHYVRIPEIAKMLIEKGSFVDVNNKEGNTPVDVIRIELENDAVMQKSTKDEMKETMLYLEKELLFCWLNKNYKQEMVDKGLITDCHREDNLMANLLRVDNKKQIEQLIKQGVDVNIKNNDGSSPLHIVVKTNFITVLDLLIKCGADVSIKDNEGNTPLHYVRIPEIANILIEHGADVNAKNNAGDTPLHCLNITKYEIFNELCDCDNTVYKAKIPEIANILIEHGADVNAKNNAGDTPLHYMVKYDVWHNKNDDSVVEITKLLMEYTGDCTMVPKMANILIEHGADVNAKNNAGNTPLQYAETDEMIQFFSAYCVSSEVKDRNEHSTDIFAEYDGSGDLPF